RIHQASMEAGERWMFSDARGKPLYSWDSRGHQFRFEYDPLRRPTQQFLIGMDAKQSDPRTINGWLNQELLIEVIQYGEGISNDLVLNLRTQVYQQKDTAGIV